MKKLLLTLIGVSAMMTALMAQPVDLSVCYGKGYTLNSKAGADATGTSPVSYQWVEDGKLLTGENASSLTIPAGKAAGTYAYVRMAANAECPTGVPSNTFTVRVHALPTVTASAVASACAGAAVDFTAAAGGGTTAAMTYTWTIAGATASTTTTAYRRTLSTTGSNTYSVSVRNSNGCVSAASPAQAITINAGAARDAAPNTCGCASGLTAINGYCRDLTADGAVHLTGCGGFNLEVRRGLIAIANFSVANFNCPSGWRPATYNEIKCIHTNANYAGFSGYYIATTTTGTSGWHHNAGCCEAGASHLVYLATAQSAWCNTLDGRPNLCNDFDGIGSYYHFRDDACFTAGTGGCAVIHSQCVR